MRKRCIAVDFDGTLSQYNGYKGVGKYGLPVAPMLRRVKDWIAAGHEVVIFTARVSIEAPAEEIEYERNSITAWLKRYGIENDLIITSTKLRRFTEIWDDRSVAVKRNTSEWHSYIHNGSHMHFDDGLHK